MLFSTTGRWGTLVRSNSLTLASGRGRSTRNANKTAARAASTTVILTIFRPVRRVVDFPGATSSVRRTPCGIISRAHAKAGRRKTEGECGDQDPHDPRRGLEDRDQKDRRHLNEQPGRYCISDRHSINVAPFELSKKEGLSLTVQSSILCGVSPTARTNEQSRSVPRPALLLVNRELGAANDVDE